MNDSTAVPAPPPQIFAPAPIPKKDQEELNIDVYQKVFKKCLKAAKELIEEVKTGEGTEQRALTVDVAKAIFKRFYEDQNAMKQGKQQAEAMMAGLSQVLEGRR